MNREKLIAHLVQEEGKVNKPYRDTVGKWTAGVGRNLDDVGLSDDEIMYLLGNDINRVEKQLDTNLTWWRGMCDARQNALASMCFQLGISGLLAFKNSLQLLRNGQYSAAADEFLNSKWASQVPARAKRVTDMIRAGEY